MKAIIWSKDHCKFCDQAKTLLTHNKVDIEERKIGNEFTKEQLLESVPTARSVPQIFIDDEYIGGFEQLKDYFNRI
jgi:glutaredoxin